MKNKCWKQVWVLLGLILFICSRSLAQLDDSGVYSTVVNLSKDWRTMATSEDLKIDTSFLRKPMDVSKWKKVQVPHNWDAYEGYRRMLHGNRHGEAAYQKFFRFHSRKKGQYYFLVFEGVGSYATIFLNGKKAGEHAGGRTSFTLDVSSLINTDGRMNRLCVWVQHPSGIKDLPWVCGGCSNERGFSEGSQPMGIFRPVRLEVKDAIRVEPMGVHAWCEAGLTAQRAVVNIATTVKNYGKLKGTVYVRNTLVDDQGLERGLAGSQFQLSSGDSIVISQTGIELRNVRLWNPDSPFLYKIITRIFIQDGRVVDKKETPFGFRSVEWTTSHQLKINSRPVFLNGIAEYEHLLGASHAFDELQIRSRFKWIKAAGFNALRDAHQPHNLLYGQLCDEQGLLWWSQLSAHVWYDTPSFRKNFKQLLKEWVLERRNEPSLILWGLQNESQLPEDFAKECTALIRSLDPTASRERLVTTCNGGAGTDWDVPQNWTGTYGGDPATYAADLKRQVLVGEYGAWRSLDFHNEEGYSQNGAVTENRFTDLIGTKISLAETVKDSVVGHFFWLLTSHDNPGRVQGGEAFREIDRIGPVNYKGLLTPWEEPTDLFYLFRASYISPKQEPVVYILSHTWPSRWIEKTGNRKVQVFSNCSEVELLVGKKSYGKIKNPGKGKAFEWSVWETEVNTIDAIGYQEGKKVTADHLDLLSISSNNKSISLDIPEARSLLKPIAGLNYIYRINCGGDDLEDSWGNRWLADRAVNSRSSTPVNEDRTFSHWGSASWSDEFERLPAFLASQRRSFDRLKEGPDQELFNSFRFGREKLKYQFPLKDGHYQVDLYFMEPWLGRTGWDASGMRVFDITFNGKILVSNLDLFKLKGFQGLVKKTVNIDVKGGRLEIGFSNIKAGQALIAAISIASRSNYKIIKEETDFHAEMNGRSIFWSHGLDEGKLQMLGGKVFQYAGLPSVAYGMDFLQYPSSQVPGNLLLKFKDETEVYFSLDSGKSKPTNLEAFEKMGIGYSIFNKDQNVIVRRPLELYRKSLNPGEKLVLDLVKISNSFLPLWVKPVSKLPPAFDLKPIQSFKTGYAFPISGAVKDSFSGREVVLIKEPRSELSWSVKTGVADVYSFTIKYYSPLKDTVSMHVNMQGTGYNRMPDFILPLTFTKTGKWNTVTFTTPSMINAGEYRLVMKVEKGAGIFINGVDVQ